MIISEYSINFYASVLQFEVLLSVISFNKNMDFADKNYKEVGRCVTPKHKVKRKWVFILHFYTFIALF